MPTYNNLTISDAVEKLYPLMKEGVQCYLKWTCPACGDRVTASEPLAFHPEHPTRVALPPGYRHDEREDGAPCGHIVSIHTHRFGVMLIYRLP